MLTFNDVVRADRPTKEHRFGPSRRRLHLDRREFLRAASASAFGFGLSIFGVFPTAKPALADHQQVYTGSCTAAMDYNCSPGCGPSAVCSACCSGGWHKNGGTGHDSLWVCESGPTGTLCYRVRKDNCTTQQSNADAWWWNPNEDCPSCNGSSKWRCHDGYQQSGYGTITTICRTCVA